MTSPHELYGAVFADVSRTAEISKALVGKGPTT